MKYLAKEIRRVRALAELSPKCYGHEYETLRRVLALLIKEVIYER